MRTFFKLEYYGGPLNCGLRYYDVLSTAIRVGKTYVKRYSTLFDHPYIEIYKVTTNPYSSTRVL